MEPASHNRFYPSPYYPVFGSRMVMIGHPGRRECVRNSLFSRAVRRFRRRVVLTGLGLRARHAQAAGAACSWPRSRRAQATLAARRNSWRGPRCLGRRGGVGCVVEQDLVRAMQIPVALEASLDAGVGVRGRAAIW